jgi:putative membrane protein insertion efficiency factor
MYVPQLRLPLAFCLILLAGTGSAAADWDPWEDLSPAEIPGPQAETNPFRLLGAMAIRAYQRTAGPLLPGRCTFHPSCSRFALKAICARGLLNGTIMGADRIMRCHGFAVLGGYRSRATDGRLEDPLCLHPSPLPCLAFIGL